MFDRGWEPEEELAEALGDLSRERHALLMSERADLAGRVANRGLWRHSLRRRRERIAELEEFVAALNDQVEAAGVSS